MAIAGPPSDKVVHRPNGLLFFKTVPTFSLMFFFLTQVIPKGPCAPRNKYVMACDDPLAFQFLCLAIVLLSQIQLNLNPNQKLGLT